MRYNKMVAGNLLSNDSIQRLLGMINNQANRFSIVFIMVMGLIGLWPVSVRCDQRPAEDVSPLAVNGQLPGGKPEGKAETSYAAQSETLEAMKKRIKFDETWPSEHYDRGFVGAKRCSICHKTEKQGRQYQIWMDTAHAHAFESLGTDEAKALGGKLGIADPQASGKCLRCHSTAYGFGETKISDDIPVEEGISCETCHGPGKDYIKLSTMQDREKAMRFGLIIPDEQTCLKCHNETAPNVKPFNFKESWEQIKHPVPDAQE